MAKKIKGIYPFFLCPKYLRLKFPRYPYLSIESPFRPIATPLIHQSKHHNHGQKILHQYGRAYSSVGNSQPRHRVAEKHRAG